jgi:hypothetical protein
MLATIRTQALAVGFALLLSTTPALGQNCLQPPTGTTTTTTTTPLQTLTQQLQTAIATLQQQNGQLTPAQVQTVLQQLQTVLTGLQQQTGQLTPTQAQTVGQQRLALARQMRSLRQNGQLSATQLQTLTQQLQNTQNSLQAQGGGSTISQLQALRQQRLTQARQARALQLRAAQLRGRR